MAEPLNATFFAFRKREKSGVLMRASIGFLVVALVLYGGFFVAFAAQLTPLGQWYAGLMGAAATNDSAAMQNLGVPPNFGAIILGYLLLIFAVCVLFAAYEAACLRWMVHGEESGGVLGLNFTPDTWRVYGGYWIWFLLYFGFSLVFGIARVPLMLGAMSGAGGAMDPWAMQLNPMVLALDLVQYGLMIFFGVRLGPAAATSVARRKFAFFDAWKVTRGRFWPLLGAFALLSVLYVVFMIVYFGVLFAAVLAPALSGLASTNDPSAVLSAIAGVFMLPRTWAVLGVLMVLGSAVGLVFYVAWFGVNARAAQAALEDGTIALA